MRKIDADAFCARVAPECKFPELLKAQLDAEPTVEERLQKPLTLEEALHKVSVWFECGVAGKSYYFEFCPAFVCLVGDEYVDIQCERGNTFSQHIENYSRIWRCWATKPTDEERKAAKWDE